MLSSHVEKIIKRRREILAAYVTTGKGLWRRAYPESFYPTIDFIDPKEMDCLELIYNIFIAVIDEHGKAIIEDEINLMYMDIENKAALGKFSEAALSAITGRLDLKSKVVEIIKSMAEDLESKFPNISHSPPNIKFRLESTVYLVRLLAYGLFSDNDIVLERVAEVFDVNELQKATKPREKRELDETLQFLYKGLIQKNERGRQGSRHAARQTLEKLDQWYPDNNYVLMCIKKIRQHL